MSERREIGALGGVASGKSKRRKKAMKERLQEALSLAVVNPNVKRMMKQIGLEDGTTNYDAVVASIIAGAIQGTPGYARLLMELIGETGEEKRAEKADRRDAKRLKLQAEEQKARIEKLDAETEALRRERDPDNDDGVVIINDAPEDTDL